MTWIAALLLVPALRADEQVTPLAVRDGHCSCIVPAGQAGDHYCLVVGSLATQAGPFHISVTSATTDAPADLPRAAVSRDPAWSRRTAEFSGRLDRARQAAAALEAFPPSPQPPRERVFYLFVGARDPRDPAGHVTIHGELQAVGRACQVYVDRETQHSDALQATTAPACGAATATAERRSCSCPGLPSTPGLSCLAAWCAAV
jgi:hypothetical protein